MSGDESSFPPTLFDRVQSKRRQQESAHKGNDSHHAEGLAPEKGREESAKNKNDVSSNKHDQERPGSLFKWGQLFFNGLVALATGVLACVGVQQAVILDRQTKIIEASEALKRRGFVMLAAPTIIAAPVATESTGTVDEIFRIDFKASNKGQGIAVIQTSLLRKRMIDAARNPLEIQWDENIAGSDINQHVPLPEGLVYSVGQADIEMNQAEAVFKRQQRLFILVEVYYSDVSLMDSRPYHTTACIEVVFLADPEMVFANRPDIARFIDLQVVKEFTSFS